MPLFQLTLFYPNLRSHATTVRKMRTAVETLSGKNWRVLSAGEQVCAIAFQTDQTALQISEALGNFSGIEQFEFLLVEVKSIKAGYMSKDVWQWLSSHAPVK